MDRNSLKGRAYRVLDQGFVQLVDFMGNDTDICQAARVSYGKGTKSISDDKNLIRYLLRHKHTTPFEMAELKLRIKIPMDAWRQMIRTRTASVNEYSTRYSEAIDEMAQTDPAEWRLQSSTNKQGSGAYLTNEIPDDYKGYDVLAGCGDNPGRYLALEEAKFHARAKALYQERLKFGIAREQARKDLPLSNYTMAYWKIDLHNLFHFLKLRCDSHAQLEIRQYANILAGFVKELYPVAFEAWYDYSFQSVNFSRLDRKFLNYLTYRYGSPDYDFDFEYIEDFYTNSDCDEHIKIGMSKRELDEFWSKLSVPTEQDFTLPQDKLLEEI